jgi:RND family efflux transporter MFP subunit
MDESMFNRRSITARRILACAGLLGAVLAAAFLAGCSSSTSKSRDPSKGMLVAVARVKRATLSHDLVLAAEFRPFQEIDVHARVAGFVKTINVDVGDHVRAGQLLATLEIPELRDEVTQAEAAARQSEAEIRRAQGELERSQSAHEVAHLAYNRLAAVSKSQPNLIAQQDLDDAQGHDRVAEAQVSAANASLAAARQQLEVAKANKERLKSLYAYSRITAPFTGVITKRYADTGAMIQAGTSSQSQAMPVVRLSQNDLLRLVIPVPESAVPRIHLGSSVEVRVSSLGKTFQGTVSRFADQVDTATRTMHTEVNVPNPHLELVPGMYAYVSVVLDRKPNAIAAPVQALNRSESQVTVYVVNPENTIEERPVVTGIETPDEVEILSGLNEGDLVVVGSRSQIRPGQTVQPKVIEEPPAGGER